MKTIESDKIEIKFTAVAKSCDLKDSDIVKKVNIFTIYLKD